MQDTSEKLIFQFHGERAELDESLKAMGKPRYGVTHYDVTFTNYNAADMRQTKDNILKETGFAYHVYTDHKFEPAYQSRVRSLYVPYLTTNPYASNLKTVENGRTITLLSDHSEFVKSFNDYIEHADIIQIKDVRQHRPKQGFFSTLFDSTVYHDETSMTGWTNKIIGPETILPDDVSHDLESYIKSLTNNKTSTSYKQDTFRSSFGIDVLQSAAAPGQEQKIFVLIKPDDIYVRAHHQFVENMGLKLSDQLSHKEFLQRVTGTKSPRIS